MGRVTPVFTAGIKKSGRNQTKTIFNRNGILYCGTKSGEAPRDGRRTEREGEIRDEREKKDCGVKNEVVNYQMPAEAITTITFFGNKYEPENVTVIEKIISDFMTENPGIRVSYESLKGTDYFEALEKRMDSGKGDDVFMVNHDAVLELGAQGRLADLSGLSSIPGYTDQMLGQMTEKNGKIYGVPTTVSVFGLYCNKDLLREHRQKIPQNLGEWEDVCDYFVKQGITPVIANNDISLKTLAIGQSFYSTYRENREAEVFGELNSGTAQLSQYLDSGFALAEEFLEKRYIDAEKALQTKKNIG